MYNNNTLTIYPYDNIPVVGVTFDNRQSILRQLSAGETLWLVREPDNAYDRNAIQVQRENGEAIGFLARGLAASLAPYLDRLEEPLPAIVAYLLGGEVLGVRINFTLPVYEY
jgi:single-stranded-DNA-specific exonuclease